MKTIIKFSTKQFILIVLITSIWINISEVFRYFVFIMPKMKDYWLGAKHSIADMNLIIFSIWGLWDTLVTAILVLMVWLFSHIFENNRQIVLVASTITWAAIFVVFWVGASNMGLSDWKILFIALPLSWIEMVVGAWISLKLYANARWA